MNAEGLLAHYERIADAPDAIARLRRFVLDLAVRGKLVEQDPDDEPTAELLKRIATETVEQIELPKGWQAARVGTLLNFQYGKGLKASERLEEGPVPVFGSNGVVGFTDEPLTVRPSIIVGRKGSAGALNLCDGPSWTTDVAYYVEAPSFFTIRFLLNALIALDLDTLGKGVKPGLSRSDAYELVLFVPPLAEQHRIVAKVEELMGLCDRLEAARKAREAVRDRLAASSLARLNAPDPETFPSDARFALTALPSLTARPDQIKHLRQTILNLAFRGKLVPQDPNDEPAGVLLERIAIDRDRMEKSGAIKKQKRIIPIVVEDWLFQLPSSWKWARFNEIAAIQSNLVDPGKYGDLPHIAPDNIEGWTARLLPYVSVKQAGVTSGKHRFKPGGILYSKIRPNLAKVTIADFEGLCSADMYPISPHILREYLVNFMITESFVDQSVSEDNRVAMPKINQAALSNILVPVPPSPSNTASSPRSMR